jgi:Flp pilus assembly protein CpaB
MKAARILILAVALAAGGAAAFLTGSDIGMGTTISSQDLQSARAQFTASEPIRQAKLIQANGATGYRAAILPSGIRATGASS